MSRYRDAFGKQLLRDMIIHTAVIYSCRRIGVGIGMDLWWLVAVAYGILNLANLAMSLRLVYWTKQLHKAQAEGIVLDAAIVVEQEYSRYLDEQL